ncbi:amidase [Sphingopyxis sp.]|uniref:amidase n=1 Tax=Sphingopyxis sp. TaxID=1908224 RepID=UPI002FCC3054
MTTFVERLDIGGDGLRVAIKDVIDIAGVPTRCGSAALADAPRAPAHAVVVDRLLDAGCRIVGKVVLHELAFGVTGINNGSGTPINPAYPDYIPGGSSSGSAVAVAAGEADIALGTDTGGSIRVPATCCGIIGIKPSFGLLDRTGASPAETSLDCIGPFARKMADIEFAMKALAPDFVSEGPADWRVGRLAVTADPAIDGAIDAALALSGLEVALAGAPGMAAAFDAGLAIINRETFMAFGHLLPSGLIGEDVAERLTAAARTTDGQVEAAELVRTRFQAEIDALLDRFDVLALPTLPTFPPRLEGAGADLSAVSLTALVRPFNLSGHPALSLPVRAAEGLPAGLQLVARRGRDALLCAVGTHLERAIASARSEGETNYA